MKILFTSVASRHRGLKKGSLLDFGDVEFQLSIVVSELKRAEVSTHSSISCLGFDYYYSENVIMYYVSRKFTYISDIEM